MFVCILLVTPSHSFWPNCLIVRCRLVLLFQMSSKRLSLRHAWRRQIWIRQMSDRTDGILTCRSYRNRSYWSGWESSTATGDYIRFLWKGAAMVLFIPSWSAPASSCLNGINDINSGTDCRPYVVYLINQSSVPFSALCGVPHGPVLGPFSFCHIPPICRA